MNKITGIIIGLVAVSGLVLGGIAINKAGSVVSTVGGSGRDGSVGPQGLQGPQGPRGAQGPAGRDGSNGSVKLGSVASPDINSPYLQWGGVTQYNAGTGLFTASTTLCMMQSPVATSTLIGGGVNIKVGSSTAIVLTISKNSVREATTTGIFATSTIAANAQGFLNIFSTSTDSTFDVDNNTIAPSTWINVTAAQGITPGSSGVGFAPVGYCTARFVQMSQ